MTGYAVEKSIKAQYVGDNLWFALFRIVADKQYITSWVLLPFLANWYLVSMLFCSRIGVTVRHRGMGTGISEASKRVPSFSFATKGGKQASSYF